MKILIINPGSTSTRIAVYEGRLRLWQEDIVHPQEVLREYKTIYSQKDMRTQTVLDALKAHGEDMSEIDCVMSRGGLLPPVPSGAFLVNEDMLRVLEERPAIHHASNLGAAIGYELAHNNGVNAYIYDPVTVDEMVDLVRITGLSEIVRHAKVHNLNMRAAALKYCEQNGLDYTKVNLVVAHIGGGSSLTLHVNGRIIDVVSDDEGPFSPERAGALPTYLLAKLIVKNGYDEPTIMKKLQREGGLTALMGTTDARHIERLIDEGDERAKLVYDAMALGVAQAIGRLAVTANGDIDAIILTGGIANSKRFTQTVAERVSFIAPVGVIAGENEMQALADGAYRVMTGAEQARIFSEEPQ